LLTVSSLLCLCTSGKVTLLFTASVLHTFRKDYPDNRFRQYSFGLSEETVVGIALLVFSNV